MHGNAWFKGVLVSLATQKKIRFEGEGIPRDELIVPAGFRMLVGPVYIEKETEGGIILTDNETKAQKYTRFIAKVLAVGDSSYQDPKYQGGLPLTGRLPKPWSKEGDIIIVGQYAGQEVYMLDDNDEVNTLKLVNDDEVLATVPNPERLVIK